MKKLPFILCAFLVPIGAFWLLRETGPTGREESSAALPPATRPGSAREKLLDPGQAARPPAVTEVLSSEEMVNYESLNYVDGPREISRVEHEASEQGVQQRLAETVARDIDAGLNAEVRQREDQLRQASAQLWVGMPAMHVLELLGSPTHVKVRGVTGMASAWKTTNLTNQTSAVTNTLYVYFPTQAQPFDRRNGFGFSVLNVRFDASGCVDKWMWEPPPLISGSRGQWRQTLGLHPPPRR